MHPFIAAELARDRVERMRAEAGSLGWRRSRETRSGWRVALGHGLVRAGSRLLRTA